MRQPGSQETPVHPHRPLRATHISTDAIPASQRLAYWEAYNATALVGLRCSSYAEAGLSAAQTNFDLGDVRLADIRGNEHVIERTPHLVRTHPKESVFASLVLESHAFFYQGTACEQVSPGDLMVYDTRRAYLFGFTTPMRQLLLDMPRAWFREHCVRDDLPRPIKIDTGTGPHRVFASALRKRLIDVAQHPADTDAMRAQREASELLRVMLLAALGATPIGASSASHMLAARSFIDDHIHDPALSAERVAHAVRVSLRHLNRLFAGEGTSVSHAILNRRLERAAADLRNPSMRAYGVAEIAYRWGFSSQAHFARVFKARFAMTPTQMRGASPPSRAE
ncbi:helix-turn-helix domain-containing protein [Pendulispora albinea]|uniref:Helix-turn-helix domain-containing protein n=1 Tax=Pendulispora albinea TaxID=2741071 RepID=A0ABZ2MA60_9BACT